jgi:transposase
VGKRRNRRYRKEFKQMVVERMEQSENIHTLAAEMGVERRLMYKWRERLDEVEKGEQPALNSRESALRKEVNQLKRVLAEKTLEVDFFKGALQKVEARRQQSGKSGAKASTTKSGK